MLLKVKMKLSDQTISILKNYSTINESLLFTEGNRLRTIAKNKSLFVYAVSAMIYNTEHQGHNGPDLNEDDHIWPAQPAGNIYGMEKLYNMQLAIEYA